MNAQERKTLQDNVNRGAKFMDEMYPGWHKTVKITKLQMKMTCDCILGQCDPGEYWSASESSNLRSGFTLPTSLGADDRNWDELGEMWKVQIRKRRGK